MRKMMLVVLVGLAMFGIVANVNAQDNDPHWYNRENQEIYFLDTRLHNGEFQTRWISIDNTVLYNWNVERVEVGTTLLGKRLIGDPGVLRYRVDECNVYTARVMVGVTDDKLGTPAIFTYRDCNAALLSFWRLSHLDGSIFDF